MVAPNEEEDSMTAPAPESFGECSDLEAFDRLCAVDGLRLLDVGCGAGDFSRALAERGAEVLAIEPDPIQAAKNRAAPKTPGVSFVEAPGQAMPAADASIDGVVFKCSLHHVPPAEMDAALAEALRVLKPGAGFLYVAEPVMAGSYAELMRPFHDETEVRRLAVDALARCIAPRFAEMSEHCYAKSVRYADFDAFLVPTLARSYNDHRREAVDTPAVRALFEAGRSGDGFVFEHRTRVNLYRGAGA